MPLNPEVAVANRSCNWLETRTTLSPRKITAAPFRDVSWPIPPDAPMLAINVPTSANDIVNPADSTHGDSVDGEPST